MAAMQTARNFLVYLFLKFPYFNGITLLMLLAERATWEKYPFIHPTVVYINVGMFIILGILLSNSWNFSNKAIISVYCGQILFLSYLFYSSKQSKYQEWQKLRLSIRPLGVIGVYCVYAFLSETRRRQNVVFHRRLGENVLGVYCIALSYMLVNFKLDRRAFFLHFLSSEVVLYVFAGALVCCAVTFLSGRYVKDGASAAAVIILCLTILMEADVKFWRKQGMETWNQVRIVGDSVCVVVGLIIIATGDLSLVVKKPSSKSD